MADHLQASLPAQIGVVAWRSARRIMRQPAAIIPPIVFPLLLLSINAAGLADAPKIPGFPADSYLAFALTFPFVQGALFATTSAGIALGQDIEGGFINRLALTPMRGAALILGQLAGAAVIALLAGAVYVVVGLAAGVRFEAGIGGIALMLVLAIGTALAFASVGAWMALRAGTAEAVQGLFPLFFATLFLSTINMPLDLIEADWFHFVAQWNPVSHIVDGMRSLVIEGWNPRLLAMAAAVQVGVLAVALSLASVALRRRLTRT